MQLLFNPAPYPERAVFYTQSLSCVPVDVLVSKYSGWWRVKVLDGPIKVDFKPRQ
jgi:hypothetical protein